MRFDWKYALLNQSALFFLCTWFAIFTVSPDFLIGNSFTILTVPILILVTFSLYVRRKVSLRCPQYKQENRQFGHGITTITMIGALLIAIIALIMIKTGNFQNLFAPIIFYFVFIMGVIKDGFSTVQNTLN